MQREQSFSNLIRTHWLAVLDKFEHPKRATSVDGHNLTIAAVIYAARYGGTVKLDPKALPAIRKSASVLREAVENGEVVYGVNTGFGGSADTRTNDVVGLQNALLRQLQFGILSNDHVERGLGKLAGGQDASALMQRTALPLSRETTKDMPLAWVRGTMAIRVNSLAGGASGIDPETLQTLLDLLSANVTPQIPLRGSISASGDLSPLSYVAGVMQGNPALKAYVDGKLLPSNEALMTKSIKAATLGPKEGLALVNGTAASAAVASLAMHEMLQLTALSQILTAMSVEALAGTDESFDPFIARVRPHPGQIDAAKNIFGFLRGSKLTTNDHNAPGVLRQDRYSLRTSTQWVGPVLEDLQLAYSQISVEINSVTDNPLIDGETGRHLHGGNFQARAVTSAMEKARQCAQTIGKMLFAQCTEMINPQLNRGLPPNLVADEPSESFLFKGVDLMLAALSSELGYLSSPVNHVETAEMGNQALNSLALISGRYTLEAIDTLSQLTAAHLGAACQALDLRVIRAKYLQHIQPAFARMVADCLAGETSIGISIESITTDAWTIFRKTLDASTTLDSPARFLAAARAVQPVILDHLPDIPSTPNSNSSRPASYLRKRTHAFAHEALAEYHSLKTSYMTSPDATPYLGAASKKVYRFVRERLGVPFVSEARLRDDERAFGTGVQSLIYGAIRSGAFWPVIVGCVEEVARETREIGAEGKQIMARL